MSEQTNTEVGGNTQNIDLKEYWIKKYKAKSAYWTHSGNPKQPHALLTGGDHSNGFFNSRLVIPDEELLREAACDLLELFEEVTEHDFLGIGIVVGPQTGATKLAELLSREIGHHCFLRFSCQTSRRK